MKLIGYLFAAGLTGIVLGTPRSVSADMMESFSHTTPSTPIPFNDTFQLPLFDTTLGTLTGVHLSLSTTGTAEVDVTNNNGGSEAFTGAMASFTITGTGPDGTSVPLSLVAGPFAGTADPLAVTSLTGLPASGSGGFDVPLANFGTYEGPGSMTATFSTSTGPGTFTGTANEGVSFGGSAVAGGTLTVTYSFIAAVPEPSSILLAGFGAVGLAWVAHCRRKN